MSARSNVHPLEQNIKHAEEPPLEITVRVPDKDIAAAGEWQTGVLEPHTLVPARTATPTSAELLRLECEFTPVERGELVRLRRGRHVEADAGGIRGRDDDVVRAHDVDLIAVQGGLDGPQIRSGRGICRLPPVGENTDDMKNLRLDGPVHGVNGA